MRGRRPTRKGVSPKRGATSSQVGVARGLRPLDRLILYVRAGGRCELCNDYLLEHHLTKGSGNFGQAAHIIAFKSGGPRGRNTRPADVNVVENLMLLCGSCHKLVDTRPAEYPVAVLKRFKTEHERRIYDTTGGKLPYRVDS